MQNIKYSKTQLVGGAGGQYINCKRQHQLSLTAFLKIVEFYNFMY